MDLSNLQAAAGSAHSDNFSLNVEQTIEKIVAQIQKESL